MFEFLNEPVALTVATALLALVGSFLNVVIHRLPKMMELGWQAQAAELRGEAITEPAVGVSTGHAQVRCRTAVIKDHRGRETSPSKRSCCGRCRHCKRSDRGPLPIVEILPASHRLCGLALRLAHGAAWRLGLPVKAMVAQLDLHRPGHATAARQPDPALLWLGLLFNLPGTFTELFVGSRRHLMPVISRCGRKWLFGWSPARKAWDMAISAARSDRRLAGWQMLPLTILLSSAVGAAGRHFADRVLRATGAMFRSLSGPISWRPAFLACSSAKISPHAIWRCDGS